MLTITTITTTNVNKTAHALLKMLLNQNEAENVCVNFTFGQYNPPLKVFASPLTFSAVGHVYCKKLFQPDNLLNCKYRPRFAEATPC